MKVYTNEEITSKIQDILGGTVKVDLNKSDRVEVTVSASYEAPTCGFSQMKKIAEFFDVENIDINDSFAYKGCDTCDFGSEYGFTMQIFP